MPTHQEFVAFESALGARSHVQMADLLGVTDVSVRRMATNRERDNVVTEPMYRLMVALLMLRQHGLFSHYVEALRQPTAVLLEQCAQNESQGDACQS